MYLKRLTLKGFKSFADATSLDLEPGVTVVVGPNGSGKSNVVDAIAWVLGAQAPSSVRSQKMDDVIFAGTSKRSALGRAEVGLTIDNASGVLPIEFSEVTITRTLFRTGESEYALNGVPCRLLDIQDLLSDSGVGRQQHVIISQGQIDAVLNAKPEDRRLIIEEAAGVLKYRKRKEKAERRLAATEANFVRLQDLLREVRRQLRPLERQAENARRHGALVAELHALRVHLAGRELTSLRIRLERVHGQQAQLRHDERDVLASLSTLDSEVLSTEARLTAMGGDDLGDDLAQFESLYERARGLAALLAERRRGVDRDRNASVDQGVVATLEAEAARVRAELAEAEAEAEAMAPQHAELAAAEAALAEARAAFETTWEGGVAAPSGRAAEVRGELAALRASIERNQGESARVANRLDALEAKADRLGGDAVTLREEIAACEHAELPLVESLEGAEQWRADAEAALAAADGALRTVQDEHHAWQARAEALALALDEARARAGAERLADLDGVLGTLLDLVDVDEGWQDAFEAAAGEALAAVVVASPDAGRRALSALAEDGLTGAVLALGGARPAASAPAVGDAVRSHVRAERDDVAELLDVLLAAAVRVDGDWTAAFDAARTNPGAVVVTARGDRFGPGGWRLGAGGAGATGAALDDARTRAAAGAQGVAQAARRRDEAAAALDEARRAESDLSAMLDANDGRMTAATDGLQRVEGERRDATTEADALRSHRDELAERLAREQDRADELAGALPALEADEADQLDAGRRMGEAREQLEAQAAAVGSLRADLDVHGAAVDQRRQFLTRRQSELEQRLARSAVERAEAEQRRVELDLRAVALDRLAAVVAERLGVVDERLGELRERRRRQSEAAREVATELEGLRRRRSETEHQLLAVRERAGRAEIELAEVQLRIETATESLRRELDTEPDVAMAATEPEVADGTTPVARARELERELRLMGPINPLALEEFEELAERHAFIEQQLDDVKESRRELAKIIRAVDDEIVNVFAAAFADVSQNFESLFQTLFPGGEGRLRLTEPDSLLATGIEIEAKPSGKNVKKLSLLSGGERSLTALAYLFAVFRARPSPFYVMDEVEAALDDVNLHRFLGLVDEFRGEAQLVIVSHQKRTMEAADCLYGVTMQPGGSSRVVSEKVRAAS